MVAASSPSPVAVTCLLRDYMVRSTRLHVAGLGGRFSAARIERHFARFGRVQSVAFAGPSRASACVVLDAAPASVEECMQASSTLDGAVLTVTAMKNPLQSLPAQDRPKTVAHASYVGWSGGHVDVAWAWSSQAELPETTLWTAGSAVLDTALQASAPCWSTSDMRVFEPPYSSLFRDDQAWRDCVTDTCPKSAWISDVMWPADMDASMICGTHAAWEGYSMPDSEPTPTSHTSSGDLFAVPPPPGLTGLW